MSPRYEVIMKSDTDWRIFDNQNNGWVYIQRSNGTTHTFKSRAIAEVYLDTLIRLG